MLADAGYSNERDLADLETRGIDGYVSLGREGKAARPRDPEQYPATSRMAEKLSRPAGRAAYAERTWLSEAPNGWIKHVLGFRRFSLRGLATVQGEWDLVCLALNTKRLHALMRRNTRGMRLATTTDRRASGSVAGQAAPQGRILLSASPFAKELPRRPTAEVAPAQ